MGRRRGQMRERTSDEARVVIGIGGEVWRQASDQTVIEQIPTEHDRPEVEKVDAA